MSEGSIVRTLRVLRAVCEGGPQTLKALSEATDLTPPTVLRILRLMADEGFVVQQPDRTWRGTMLVSRLGHAVNATVGLSTIAQQFTDRITAELDETSVFAVYEDGVVTYSAHSEPVKPVRAHVRLGRGYPLLTTVTGQAVLAWLPPERIEQAIDEHFAHNGQGFASREEVYARLAEIRRQGHASGVGVRWPEVWGAGAPVFGPSGAPVGALGVSIPVVRVAKKPTATIEVVRKAAADLTAQLGGHVPPPPES